MAPRRKTEGASACCFHTAFGPDCLFPTHYSMHRQLFSPRQHMSQEKERAAHARQRTHTTEGAVRVLGRCDRRTHVLVLFNFVCSSSVGGARKTIKLRTGQQTPHVFILGGGILCHTLFFGRSRNKN
jgi:hypothetical protein